MKKLVGGFFLTTTLLALLGVAQAADPVLIRDAAAALAADLPEAKLHYQATRIARVYGTPLAYGTTPEETSELFLLVRSALFGVEPDELELTGFPGGMGAVQPVMFDPETGDYKFFLYRYVQSKAGIPVFESDLRLLVANLPGYPLVLAASSLHDLSGFEPEAGLINVRTDLARAAVASTPKADVAGAQRGAAFSELINFEPPELVIWAGLEDTLVEPRMAVTYVGDNGLEGTSEHAKWLFVADAVTGEILYARDMILFTDVIGNVSGKATADSWGMQCGPAPVTPFPYAYVNISGGGSANANASGDFTISNPGTTPVTVYSYIRGLYFRVYNQAGGDEQLSQAVTPPGPANFVHNNANTSDTIRAQANGYVKANQVRGFTLTQNPSYPTIWSQTNFTVYVNSSGGYCPGNAWYDGSSINFCLAGSSYSNTAFGSVIHHEYGHHLVASGGSGQGAYGEGMSDSIAMLITDDPRLGVGFYTSDCVGGIRSADNTMQYPCSGAIHYCGQLLSGCIWSVRNELIVTEPQDYLAILSNLTVNSILLHSGESIDPSICIDFLTLDDNDGDLSNGTPHYDEITAGFAAHGMWAGPPPENDNCADAAMACPGTYTHSTSGLTNDGTASCGSSNSTPDVWYKYTPASNGTLTVNLCASSYDTVVSVHTGCPGTSGNEIGCNDDTGWFGPCGGILPRQQSYLQVTVAAGNTYYIRISGRNGATGTYVMSLSGPACAPSDTTPPAPNPMTFALPPAAISSSAIGMTATTATDSTPPVSYYFDFVSGGSGGADSGWQTSTGYTNVGLAPNTQYAYRVRARDNAAPPNETAYSVEAAATTFANVPGAPALGNATHEMIDLNVTPNGNPDYTEFAIQCTATSPTDAAWEGKYVSVGGQPSAGAVWQTDGQWDTLAIRGLQDCTQYTFAVQARNLVMIQTAFGSAAALSTSLLGDLDDNDQVDIADLAQMLSNYGTASGADYSMGDLDGDGDVDIQDLALLLSIYGETCP